MKLLWENATIIEKRGGLIPVGGIVNPFYTGNLVLIGDAAGIVSPLTAGGIHTALFFGSRLGQLICGYLQHGGLHPGPVLKKEFPKFYRKHFYRWVFNYIPNWLFNILLQIPGFKYLAYMLFFIKKRLPKSHAHIKIN
jgi:flavin-dependent dehydrogenase